MNGNLEPYKAPIHGQEHDKLTYAWQLALSIIEGLEQGSYTLGGVKAEAQMRLRKLDVDPLRAREIKIDDGVRLPPNPEGKGTKRGKAW